ncbi:MAG: DDE-type integrase/transposase/recombinase [Nitrososphaeraceae archaeon]|nr:DDE-type integrase/transposase/recombinase [Nitrososphaeraceae archaeon]
MELDSEIASYLIYQRKKKRATTYIIDETVIEIAKKHFWLWICIEPIHSSVLRIHISNERNMLVAEHFIRFLVEKY